MLGTDFASATRDGYWRLKLEQVRLQQPGVDIAIDEVSLLQPVGWLIERVSPGSLTSPERPAIEVLAPQVTLTEAPASSEPSRITSTVQALSEGLRIARRISAWIAYGRLSEGAVWLGGQSLNVSEATWAGGSLSARIEHELLGQPMGIRLSLLEEPGFRIEVDHELASANLTLREGFVGGQRPLGNRLEDAWWKGSGQITALQGTGKIEAEFRAYEGSLPQLRIDVHGMQWPEDRIPLPHWVHVGGGDVVIRGTGSSVIVGLGAELAVNPGNGSERTIQTTFVGSVKLEEASLQSLSATMPGLNIALVQPVSMPLAWPFRGANFTLNLVSDLSDLSDSLVAGNVGGELIGTSSGALLPSAGLHLQGSDLAFAGKVFGQFALDASFDWPDLRLDHLELGDPDSALTATGRVDLATRNIRSLHWQLDGLPAAFTNLVNLTKLAASGEISGPLANPHQGGTLEVEALDLPGLYPMAVHAEWSGAGLALTNFLVNASANTGELVVGGAADANLDDPTPGLDLRLEQLGLLRGGQPLLSLSQPSGISIRFPRSAANATTRSPQVGIPHLELAGDTRNLRLTGSVTWPDEGRILAEAAGLQATDPRDFVPNVPDWIRLDRLRLDTGWTNGPAAFDLDASFALAPIPDEPLSLNTTVASAGTNLELRTVQIRRKDEALAELSGELPLSLEPGHPGGLLRLHPEGRLLTRLKADQAGPLWSELTRWFGVTAVGPNLTVTLTGTGGAPRGHVQFAATELRSENAIRGIAIPPIESPKLTATLDDTGKLTASAEAKLAGQRGTLSATLPLNLAALTNAQAKFGLPDLKPLQARLRLPGWRVAPLAAFAPTLLGSQGELDVDLSVQPGLRLDGRIALTNLATQPFPPVGVIRQVHAAARLSNDGITLESAGALLGNERVHVAGDWHFGTNGPPGYAFTVTGTNLPLARQPDVFLRGDVAMQLTGTNLTNAVASGDVTLRNSLLLRDLQSLVSGNIETPAARPPFFSIPTPPLADWRLDLRVRGEEFLHVVTPVFRGRVSAALQLGGTLREPVALGDVTLPSGRVTFPFGGLKVDAGRVSLTRGNPYIPSIAFQASGLNFGYEVRMDVSGPATAPNVLFSSVPPLSSMQILLMLTSGDIPSETFHYSSRSRMQQIGMFVGKEFLGKLTGDPESDRLSMRSGEEVTDRGQLTYSIEYRLSPRWSLFGQRDRFDSYGAGVKWRVFSK